MRRWSRLCRHMAERSQMHRSRWLASLAIAGLVVVVGFNIVAFMHARAMTHFVPAGERTLAPEKLSVLQRIAVLATGVTVVKPRNRRDPADVGLTFTTHMIAGAPRLEAWLVSHPQPRGLVLMFHGYGGCKASLLAAARGFADLGWASLMVDFRAAGGSDGWRSSLGVHEAKDVARVASFATQLDVPGPRVMYGFSMGAVAILRAVAKGLIEPTAAIIGAPFDRLRTTVAHRFTAMGLAAWPAADVLLFWGRAQHGFLGESHDPVTYARAVRFPVLQLHGSLDRRVRPPEARAVFAQLAGDKTMHVFDGLGHCIYAAQRPRAWRAIVGPFLEAVSAPVASR